MTRWLLLVCLCHAGCARPARVSPLAVELRPSEAMPLEYERILASHTVDPHLLILLDPRLCERFCQSSPRVAGLDRMANAFVRLGWPRGEAAARLNSGALLWQDGSADEAYHQIMRARALFAQLGDVEGLAHAYEWLGFVFAASGEEEHAIESLSVAYRLFDMLGDHAASERVLGYGG